MQLADSTALKTHQTEKVQTSIILKATPLLLHLRRGGLAELAFRSPRCISICLREENFPKMPTSATSNHPCRPEDLIGRLNSAHTPYEAKLKALRDLKNQIIGNRTKKLAFLKLGAVPSVVSILSSAAAAQGGGGDNREFYESVLIQSAAVIGSFACGLDAGVKAVLDAGAFPLLLSLISHLNEKVADAGARSLKLIYQSKRAPKYEFLLEKNMEFLLSLLNSKNENKDASLESLAAMVKENPEVSAKFMGPENGRALNVVIELMKDKHPRTRLLACMCLISIRNTSTSYLQDSGIKNTLVSVLLELLDDPGPVGDEASFVLSSLITEKEDMQKIAFNANLIEKLCEHLNAGSCQAKRLQGIFLVLGDLCSKLECCRDRVLDLQGMYALSNVASGNELHKEAVMNQLLPQAGNDTEKTLVKFLQSTDSRLRTATLWALINLTFPGSPGTCRRVTELRNAGIITQLKNMVNDHCLDVKLRARMALGQLMIFGDSSS
ncbi:UNVERIFIED_CONTAM: hypothetical protein Slati_0547100 [Sesamum latifolium]|uniref:Armadillo repeat-containing protein 8 n=1 Tax=Sesamum latifolium TaxID=2727402 RepID=A0AAW2XYK2_9LAMI